MTGASDPFDLGGFTADARLSYTLPATWYRDPAIHEAERQRIFRRAWNYVGHASDLAAPGAYLTDEIGGESLFLVRERAGTVRAFYNVCRHRAHRLLDGIGHLRGAITCPYHAWAYDLDGRLKAARFCDHVEGFDKAQFPLKPIACTEVNGLLFVNLDDAPLPFAQEGPAFEPQLSAFLPDLRCFARAHRSVFRIKANWKAVVDNFSETYHAPVAHRRLGNVVELEGFRPQHHRRFTYFASKSGTGDTSFAVKPGEDYPTWTLWPNLCLLSLPGSRNLVVMRMQPDGPEGCLEQVDFYVDASADRAPPEALRQAIRFFDESLNPEDIALVESVQRGLNSRAYSQGRYVVDAADSWFSESALHHFHKQVVEAVLKT